MAISNPRLSRLQFSPYSSVGNRQMQLSSQKTTRRKILTSAVAFGSIASVSQFPSFMPAVYASDAPEQPKVNFGFIALTDCSPLAIAHEKGFFKKYGIISVPVKPANWAAVRDSLVKGDVDCTHMLLGMPIASTMGLGGTKPVPMIVPWILNRNGQAISLKSEWKGSAAADPTALKPLVEAMKKKGQKPTFARSAGVSFFDGGVTLGDDQNFFFFPSDSGLDGSDGLQAPDRKWHQEIGEQDRIFDWEDGKRLFGFRHVINLLALKMSDWH